MEETGGVVTRVHRLVGAGGGVLFGANLAVFGYFIGQFVVTAVAGAFVAVGIALLVPALIYAQSAGGFPPARDESVLGTGLNPAALGFALDIGGLSMVFAVFVVEATVPSIAVGVVALGVVYALLDWLVPTRTPDEVDDVTTETNTAGLYGLAAGFLLYSAADAWTRSRGATAVFLAVAVVLVAVGAREEGYL